MRSKYATGANSTRAAGFALAAVCYCFLAFLLSLTPAHVLWWLLAIVVIPGLTGALAAKGTSRIDTSGQRFSSGFWTCSVPMFVYTGVSLMIAHHKVGPSDNAGSVLLVGALVACAYTLMAGIVAGLAGIICYRQANRPGGTA